MTNKTNPEGVKLAIEAAFIAGCWAVQDNYRPLRDGEDPEFGEAASDYADTILAALSAPLGAEDGKSIRSRCAPLLEDPMPNGAVTVPIETARTIDGVFLPHNPNKMRSPHPDVLSAVREFKALVAAFPTLPAPPSSLDRSSEDGEAS